MSGRRHGGAGIRRGVRSKRHRKSIAKILGASARLIYNAVPGNWTPGTGPDVAAVPNLAVSGLADLNSPSEAQRPHYGTVGGLDAFNFDRTASQYLQTAAPGSNILTSSDGDVDIWCVGGFGSNNQCLFELSNSTSPNQGALVFLSGTTLTARIVSGGQKDVPVAAWGPDTDQHIFRMRYVASDMEFFIDEASQGNIACSATLDNNLTHAFIGALANGNFPHDGNIQEFVVARDASAEQRAAVTALLAADWGISI